MSWATLVVILWLLDIALRICVPGFLSVTEGNYNTLYRDRGLYIIPGVLHEARNQISPVEKAFSQWGQSYYVNWGRWLYSPTVNKYVLARRIANAKRKQRSYYFNDVLVATSLGGSVALDTAERLHKIAPDLPKPGLIVLEGVAGSENLLAGGNIAGPVFRAARWFVPLGLVGLSLVNVIVLPLQYFVLNKPPKDGEIEDGLDKEAVKRKARRDMFGYSVSTFTRQTAHMNACKLTPDKLRNFAWVQYYSCTKGNVTVRQPEEMNKWNQAAVRAGVYFHRVEVETPHVAFEQMPSAWLSSLDDNLPWCFAKKK
jgi:hypothetical protein